ncbi:T9SS type A sorting domain-containing protein [Marivirga sp. S37H4]|uniref:T9SS type A sorting domain-containing protein n=1 Tax=Marivirga aurantiaca TaxID=2802615 RepID=A0A935C8M9_9BACT|nr:T9SS type A sorting domain-containing protein [Marivirga aurantiaca]MBK6263788.1 T9SS type A sorting domain-containing protein [Marivirga aurantiaca]
MKKIILTYLFTFALITHLSVQDSYSKIVPYSGNEVAKQKIALNQNSNIEILKIEAYPNPAEEYIYIKFKEQGGQKVQIDVMSFIGNKMNVSSERIESGLYKLNLRNIASGHYYALVTVGNEKHIKKFLKQ